MATERTTGERAEPQDHDAVAADHDEIHSNRKVKVVRDQSPDLSLRRNESYRRVRDDRCTRRNHYRLEVGAPRFSPNHQREKPMVAKRKKKRAARKERSVQILPNRIVVRDERLVVVVRGRSKQWHTGEDLNRAGVPVARAKPFSPTLWAESPSATRCRGRRARAKAARTTSPSPNASRCARVRDRLAPCAPGGQRRFPPLVYGR